MSNNPTPEPAGSWYRNRRNRAAHFFSPGETLAACGTYAQNAGSRTPGNAHPKGNAERCQLCLGTIQKLGSLANPSAPSPERLDAYQPTVEDLRAAGLIVRDSGDGIEAGRKYVSWADGGFDNATRQVVIWNDGTFRLARRDPGQHLRQFWFWDWGPVVWGYPSLAWVLAWLSAYTPTAPGAADNSPEQPKQTTL